MKAVVTLRPSESKRLIAKAVADMDAVQKAWDRAYMLIPDAFSALLKFSLFTIG